MPPPSSLTARPLFILSRAVRFSYRPFLLVSPRTRHARPLRTQTNHKTGLSTAEVEERRLKWGWNELAERKVNPILQFLAYFWGPMPAMIWLAVIVEFIKGVLGACLAPPPPAAVASRARR